MGDIKFESFDKIRNSTPPMSPIRNDDLLSNHLNDDYGLTSFETQAPNDSDGDEIQRNGRSRNDSENGDAHGNSDGIETSACSGRGPATPTLTRKGGSDYVASVTGMKSAFSFCTSPCEGRQIDVNELMRGDLSNKAIDDDVAMVSAIVISCLFPYNLSFLPCEI